MFTCPTCRCRLQQIKGEAGICFVCPRCKGRAAALTVLRRAAGRCCSKHLWWPKEAAVASAKKCPICQRRMREAPVPVGNREMRLDLCRPCQFVWFDPREFEALPPAPPERPKLDLPLEAREKVAVAQVRYLEERNREREESEFEGPPPDEPWKWVPAILGLPVEESVEPLQRWPWLTWGLAAILVLIFAATAQNLAAAVEQFGLVPSRMFHGEAFTLLTSFFLHGGLWHLVANVYFLLIFGDNVEDYLGRLRYALLLAISSLSGDLLHVLFEPRADIPTIGASGGISGVIVFYALQFPHARLGFLERYFFIFRWLYLPAWIALVLWFVLQTLGTVGQVAGGGSVSSLAHLGGAAVGLAAWCVWRRQA